MREQAHDALTHFKHEDEGEGESTGVQRWGLVAADVVDHPDRIEVRMEVPGLAKEDLKVEIGPGEALTVVAEAVIEAAAVAVEEIAAAVSDRAAEDAPEAIADGTRLG